MKYTNLFFFLLIFNQLVGQRIDFTPSFLTASCSGTTLEFEAVFIPSEISVTEFDFNDGFLPSGWKSSPFNVGAYCNSPSGDTNDNSDYFWALETQQTGENIGKRFVETSAVDVSQGGSIEFFIRYGSDNPGIGDNIYPQQNGCEDPDASNEEVYLQYKLDGGNWITIYEDWDTDNSKSAAWYNWHYNDIEIPAGAKSRSTQFRWYQPANSSDVYDNWGLDDIVVNAIPPPSASWEANFGYNANIEHYSIASNTVSFTKLFPVSNQDNSYLVTVSTTLSNGLTLSVSKTVLVTASDPSKANVIPPPDLIVDTDLGICTATLVSAGTVTATDNCAIISIENDNPSLVFTLGENILTWIVTDAASNTTTVTQKITVVDNQPPILTIPNDITTGNCSVTIGVASATDNCDLALTPSNNAPIVFPLGITAVTWQVTDANGNTASATQLVTVSDTTAPTIIAPANINASSDIDSCEAKTIVLVDPIASDNCTVASISNNAPASFPTGVTTITWTVLDTAGNSATVTQTVIIRDSTPPDLTAPPDIISDSCVIVLGTPTITDNCSFTYSNNAPESFSSGITTVTWTASDTYGNTVTATQLISFSDNTTPTISIQDQDVVINADADSCYASGVDLGSVVTNDDCGIASVSNNAPLQFPIGTTFVTHTVRDVFGNSNSTTQSVTVVDVQAPVILASDLVLSLNSNGEVVIPFELIDNGSYDNCEISTFSIVSENSDNIFTQETDIPEVMGGSQNDDLTCEMISLNGLVINESGNITLPSPQYGNIISFYADYQDYDSGDKRFDVVDNETERTIIFRIGIPSNFANSSEEFIECNATTLQPPLVSVSKSSSVIGRSNTKVKSFTSKKIVISCENLGPQQLVYSITDSSGNTASTTVNITITDDLQVCNAPPVSGGSSGSGGDSTLDTDNDGVIDTLDAFPNDPSEWTDTDADGIGNNLDTDDDADGYLDTTEVLAGSDSLDRISIPLDSDSDGIINLLDDDDDNDGFTDIIENEVGTDALDISNFPLDTDNDLELDFYDLDDDNDGQSDLIEIQCGSDPLNNLSRALDTDFDGIPNCLDVDDDNDGFEDQIEINEGTDPLNVYEYPSLDIDGDGVPFSLGASQNFNDNCPEIPNPDQLDTDDDLVGDACDNCIENENYDQSDIDQDGVGDVCDVCSEIFNPEQEDYDQDSFGDLCDLDDDNDGQTDEDEIACGSDPKDERSLSPDSDGDGILDCFDLDNDNDGIEDSIDPNPSSFDDLLISQFVSDNNDGINDTWKLLKIEDYTNNQVYIYTRSGVLIYQKRNYLNTWPADADSNLIPEGNYYFRIDLESNDIIDYEGWLYLTR